MTSFPRPTRIVAAATTAAVLAVGGCATGPTLADRTQPSVRAQERRIEGLLAGGDPAAYIAPSGCRVRLLRQPG